MSSSLSKFSIHFNLVSLYANLHCRAQSPRLIFNPLNIAIDGFIATFRKHSISSHSDPNLIKLHVQSFQGLYLTSTLQWGSHHHCTYYNRAKLLIDPKAHFGYEIGQIGYQTAPNYTHIIFTKEKVADSRNKIQIIVFSDAISRKTDFKGLICTS